MKCADGLKLTDGKHIGAFRLRNNSVVTAVSKPQRPLAGPTSDLPVGPTTTSAGTASSSREAQENTGTEQTGQSTQEVDEVSGGGRSQEESPAVRRVEAVGQGSNPPLTAAQAKRAVIVERIPMKTIVR